MKKIVFFLLSLVVAGCNTLEQNPSDKLFESNAFQTEAALELYCGRAPERAIKIAPTVSGCAAAESSNAWNTTVLM